MTAQSVDPGSPDFSFQASYVGSIFGVSKRSSCFIVFSILQQQTLEDFSHFQEGYVSELVILYEVLHPIRAKHRRRKLDNSEYICPAQLPLSDIQALACLSGNKYSEVFQPSLVPITLPLLDAFKVKILFAACPTLTL
jgi:hypothetical protein